MGTLQTFSSCVMNDLTPSCLANQHRIELTSSCDFLREYSKEKSSTEVFERDDTMCICLYDISCV